MPHARSACETLDDFVELHYPQLQILGVPQKYWPALFNKLKNEVSTHIACRLCMYVMCRIIRLFLNAENSCCSSCPHLELTESKLLLVKSREKIRVISKLQLMGLELFICTCSLYRAQCWAFLRGHVSQDSSYLLPWNKSSYPDSGPVGS